MTTLQYYGPVTALIDDSLRLIELRYAPPGRQPLSAGVKAKAVTWAISRLKKEYPGYSFDLSEVQR